MIKVFEITLPIRLSSPHKGRLAKWRSAVRSICHRELTITRTEPIEVIESILQNYTNRLINSENVPLIVSFAEAVLRYSPQHRKTIKLRHKADKSCHIVKVLQKGSKGEELSAMWKLKITEHEAVLSLFRPAPRQLCSVPVLFVPRYIYSSMLFF